MKLKLRHFGHLMQRTDSFERPWLWERLKAGGEEDDRGRDIWMVSLTQWRCLSKLQEFVMDRVELKVTEKQSEMFQFLGVEYKQQL